MDGDPVATDGLGDWPYSLATHEQRALEHLSQLLQSTYTPQRCCRWGWWPGCPMSSAALPPA